MENKIYSKVFFWLFIGLFITFLTGTYVSTNEKLLSIIFSNNYYLIFSLIELGLAIFLSVRIHKMSSTTAKISYILYTLFSGLTFASIFVIYKLQSIILVFIVTAIVFLIFAAIGYFTKIDLTKLGIYLFMALLGIIICSVINIFIGSAGFNFGLTVACLIIFIIYIAYDIQIIKRNLYMIEEEDNLAIYGALQLYLDFINIFLRLLQLFGRSRD